MTTTVGDVIGLPEVQAGDPQVLCAARWNDAIRWLHVGEAAELPSLLHGGELVFTTGAGVRDAPEGYLRALADAGARGLVVELGPSFIAPPPGLADLAARLDLALVVLHRPIRFVGVTEVVHRRIVAEQYDEVAFDRRVHTTFTELGLQRATTAGIVDAAAEILGHPVVLEDLAHRAVALSARGEAAALLLTDWERRSRRAPTGGGADEAWAVTSVGPRGEEWGRLMVPDRPADPARASMVLERAAAALAMHRMVERDRTGLQQQAQSGLIDDVLGGRTTDEREVAARAHALGLARSARYHPVVVRIDPPGRGADPVDARRRTVALMDTVCHTVNAAGHSGLFAVRADDEIAVVLALRAARGPHDLRLAELGERLRTELGRVHRATAPVCAVARPAADVAGTIRALGEAAHIAEVALAMGGHRVVVTAADVRLRGLLVLLRDDPRVQRFAESELDALLTGEVAGGVSDLEVLRAHLELGGNKAAVAERLHMSRPTLYKRLAVLTDVLGVSLDDAESRTSLHVALLVRDAQRARAG